MSVISLDEVRKQLASTGSSVSQSTQNASLDKHGPTATNEEMDEQVLKLFDVAMKALENPFKVKSRFARDYAMYVAIACTLGVITNRLSDEEWLDSWMITDLGMDFIEECIRDGYEITD